jgi:hypothetical protein
MRTTLRAVFVFVVSAVIYLFTELDASACYYPFGC